LNLNRTTGQDGCRSTVQVNCRFIGVRKALRISRQARS